MIIKSVRVSAGFLADQTFCFSPDLNCLLGGTGVGKSLLIEIIRFGLASQPDATDFAHVRSEVDSRLDKALGVNSTIEIVVERGGPSTPYAASTRVLRHLHQRWSAPTRPPTWTTA